MNLQLLVTEANLIKYGLLQQGQHISPVVLVGFRDTQASRREAEKHISWVSAQAELAFMNRLRAQRVESIKTIRTNQRSEDAQASERAASQTGAEPSSRSEGKTPFTLLYAPRLRDMSWYKTLFTLSLLEYGQISHRRWTKTKYSDYLDLIDPFLSHPKRRRPRAGGYLISGQKYTFYSL